MFKKILKFVGIAILVLIVINILQGDQKATEKSIPPGPYVINDEWGNLRKVEIRGFEGNAQEPFISRDSEYLFFNDWKPQDKDDQKSMHWATRIDDATFQYQGMLAGANTGAEVDGAPSMDAGGNYYWITTGTYFDDHLTVAKGYFDGAEVKGMTKVTGNYHRNTKPYVNFDVEVSKSGDELYIVDGLMENGGPVEANFLLVDNQGNKLDQSLIDSINSDHLEYAASISSDDLELYFTRAPEVSLDTDIGIYVATRNSPLEAFGEPERISAVGTGFLEAPAINDSGNLLYFHKFDGRKFNIYVVERNI